MQSVLECSFTAGLAVAGAVLMLKNSIGSVSIESNITCSAAEAARHISTGATKGGVIGVLVVMLLFLAIGLTIFGPKGLPGSLFAFLMVSVVLDITILQCSFLWIVA